MDLQNVRAAVEEFCASCAVEEGPCGQYWEGGTPGDRLYASADVVILRTIMGENLRETLTDGQRREWIEYINSFARAEDGSYARYTHHSKLHANGTVIGALGVLGGRQRYPVTLYDPFDSPEAVRIWLEDAIDWREQWTASHEFWGGLHCYSTSDRVTEEWLDAVFEWLNDNVDPETGWWRDGVDHADERQPLGGAVHVYPIYQHHGRAFPYPRRVIDSVLDMQREDGTWSRADTPGTYLDLDALYAFRVMREFAPEYRRDDVDRAILRFGRTMERGFDDDQLAGGHVHDVLAVVGTFGLLRQHVPDRYEDAREWTDIFSDPRLYRTAAVDNVPENR